MESVEGVFNTAGVAPETLDEASKLIAVADMSGKLFTAGDGMVKAAPLSGQAAPQYILNGDWELNSRLVNGGWELNSKQLSEF